MNGIALYHLHVYRRLIKWKKKHAQHVNDWLDVIGEFESLGSLANFSYNNPNFAYPTINTNDVIGFTDLGHPLIDRETRVDNSVSFEHQKFIILTGSNMSGKSTFLRSLGINMVLGSIGSCICASSATITPSKVWVSMRMSDSLDENESYFFAEVKRLKQIMVHTATGPSFILLDEILRGTNSDDKRHGTIDVIKKLLSKNVIGTIATHDLEVCLTTDEYPTKLTNKCFEVEIIDDELYFDYKLREGICKNKSATFLMKKMGVI
jgi:DNA mismatch repair ATPase MutS